jgi:hypothetical protein
MTVRKLIGKITSPIFVPLRKLVVWGDEQFGTCDHKLSVVPREYNETLKLEEDPVEKASELEIKLSKDKANLIQSKLGEAESELKDDEMVGC